MAQQGKLKNRQRVGQISGRSASASARTTHYARKPKLLRQESPRLLQEQKSSSWFYTACAAHSSLDVLQHGSTTRRRAFCSCSPTSRKRYASPGARSPASRARRPTCSSKRRPAARLRHEPARLRAHAVASPNKGCRGHRRGGDQRHDRVVYEWEGYTIAGHFGQPFEKKAGLKGGDFAGERDYARFVGR